MKLTLPTLIIGFFFIFFSSSLFCQTDCITGDCTKDFTQKFYNIDSNILYTYFSAQEQANGFPDLGDVYYQKRVVTTPPIKDEGCNNDPDACLHDGAAFKYYAYYPTKSIATGQSFNYSTCKPPAIIIFHGGGFSDCATLDADEITFLCRGFARRGYVVFDVEYRGGRLIDPDNGANINKYVTVQQSLAIYRAMQDARGAIRTIIQRQLDQNANSGGTYPFQFDANTIF